jgi:hypothetical protein
MIGGVGILVVSDRGHVDGLVIWGMMSAALVFTSGRSAIAILKREVQRLRGVPPA